MQRTLDETAISFKIVADEDSYPEFRFLSHVLVKPHQINQVRKTILIEGVNIANKLMV